MLAAAQQRRNKTVGKEKYLLLKHAKRFLPARLENANALEIRIVLTVFADFESRVFISMYVIRFSTRFAS